VDTPLPGLEHGLTTRPLTRGDAQAVVDVVAACEVDEFGEVFIEIEDVWSDWDRPGYDLAEESIGVVEADRLVAVAEVFKGRRAEVNVHPDHQGRGVGTALMRWTWSQAARHGSALVGETVSDNNEAAIGLLRRHGYEALWHSWVLELPPDAPIVVPDPLPGFRLRPMRLGQDEHAAYQVIEDAFNEWPNRDPRSYDEWAPGVVGRGGFEPWHLLLATRVGDDGEEVVGTCHLVMSGDEGWVNQVAVRRDQRGLGLGRALLASSFAAARERGATRFGLSTDSRTGALGLYERVGMTARLTYTHWAKRL
jgi:ribosomal protein S18 acetylase RimI-like enzyme